MNLGDKLATLIYWIVMGGIGLVAGGVAMFAVWTAIADGAANAYTWMTLGVGVFLLLASALGFRQCYRILRNRNPADTNQLPAGANTGGSWAGLAVT